VVGHPKSVVVWLSNPVVVERPYPVVEKLIDSVVVGALKQVDLVTLAVLTRVGRWEQPVVGRRQEPVVVEALKLVDCIASGSWVGKETVGVGTSSCCVSE
jgi:hypothetical protein